MAGIPLGVFWRIFVPPRAVRNQREAGGGTYPAEDIFAVCDGLKVRGIATQPVPAKMVENQPGRDWSAPQLVGHAVYALHLPVPPNLAVPAPVFCSRPNVASRGGVSGEAIKKPLNWQC